MTDLLLLAVLLPAFIIGLQMPVVAFCIYVWLDLVMPQQVTYGFASSLPLSMLAAGICLLSMMINNKKLSKPASAAIPFLLIFFTIWITVTTYNAMFPSVAWVKWDWAFKTLVSATLMMFVFRDRDDFEVLQLTILVAVAYFAVTLGPKALLGGAGYGRSLIRGQVNFGLYESSTLSAVAASMIPIVFYLKRHTRLLPVYLRKAPLWYGFVALLVATIIGTYARTGLVCLAYLCVVGFVLSKRKIGLVFLIGVLGLVFVNIVSDSWVDRMSTMQNVEEESSAVGRLVVWRWTIDFAASHALGGGFHAYLANEGMLTEYSDFGDAFNSAKAFHSIYFEVLGEHGYIGLFVFLSMLTLALLKMLAIYKTAPKDDDPWLRDACFAIFISLSTFLVGASFVGIAFRPYIYYFLVLALILEKIHRASSKS